MVLCNINGCQTCDTSKISEALRSSLFENIPFYLVLSSNKTLPGETSFVVNAIIFFNVKKVSSDLLLRTHTELVWQKKNLDRN